jgi:hypothetical protein
MLLWARALWDSVVAKQQPQTSPHTLSSQNQKTCATLCVGLKITIYFIAKTLNILAMRREASRLLRFARNDGICFRFLFGFPPARE